MEFSGFIKIRPDLQRIGGKNGTQVAPVFVICLKITETDEIADVMLMLAVTLTSFIALYLIVLI